MQIKTILVPTDFSKFADEGVQRAVQLAELTHATIHLVHASELPTMVGALDVPLTVPPEFFDRIRDSAQSQLDQCAKTVRAAGLEAHVHLACDTPARAILEAAVQVGADLIVMGTHGRTGMKHVLLGSVAERIVRLATCPVLTVKPAE